MSQDRTYLLAVVGESGFLGAAVLDVSAGDAADLGWENAAIARAAAAGYLHPGGLTVLARLRPEQATIDLSVIPRRRLSIDDLVRVGLIRLH